jgi:thioredoxin reductase (NADPH)
VTVLIRGRQPTASKYLVDEMVNNEKIELKTSTDPLEVKATTLEQITFKNTDTGEISALDVSALFVFIGVRPQSQMVADLVKCSDKGYILTGSDLIVDKKLPQGWSLERAPYLLETSVPGIFAAATCAWTNHRAPRRSAKARSPTPWSRNT